MNKKARIGIIAAVSAVVLAALGFGVKAWLGASSPRTVVKPVYGPNIHVEELSFFTGLEKIAGKVYKPQDTLGRKPVLICCSGLGTPGSAWDDVCRAMAKRGIISYLFDFRGGCPGSPSGGRTVDMTISSEKEDLTLVLKRILKEDFTDTDKVYLIGHSQGALVAALVGSGFRNEVAGMILLAPAFNISDLVGNQFPSKRDVPDSAMFVNMYVGRKYINESKSLDAYKWLHRYKKKVLILHGKNDSLVPAEYSELAAEEFPNAELILLDGVSHSFEGNFKFKYINKYFDEQLNN